MDNKNIFIAIALSLSVLLFWSAFFETPQPVQQNKANQQIQEKTGENNDIAPNINQLEKKKTISREDSIKKVERVSIENEKVLGSISLEGGIFDDLSFKNYKESLNKDKLREMISQAVVQELTFREQARVKKGTPVVYRRVEGPDFKERKEYRGRWMGFTDKSKLDSMVEFDPGTGPDGSDFLRIETAELMLDN